MVWLWGKGWKPKPLRTPISASLQGATHGMALWDAKGVKIAIVYDKNTAEEIVRRCNGGPDCAACHNGSLCKLHEKAGESFELLQMLQEFQEKGEAPNSMAWEQVRLHIRGILG